MKALFIHPNFPGQFRHLASYLAAQPQHQVIGLGEMQSVSAQRGSTPGVILRGYKMARPASKGVHHYLSNLENSILHAQATLRECLELKKLGFTPDVICVHAGWGGALYLREVFPKARIVGYFEYHYHAQGADIGFDPEFPVSLDNRCEVLTKNATHLLSWANCDAGWAPTRWQGQLIPKEYHAKLHIIHDGINTDRLYPNPEAQFTLADGRTLSRHDEVLTFINRNMEPYRGFHIFMRTLPEIQRRRPQAMTLIIGSDDDVAYGNKPSTGKTWRETLLAEVGDQLDMSRLYFVGQLAYAQYLQVLQLSRAHIYMTYPYILSWSMLEAMAAGCVVIGSNTPPVAELIQHGNNGLLFDFFDQAELANCVEAALANPAQFDSLRQQARHTIIGQYDLKTVCLPKQLALLHGNL